MLPTHINIKRIFGIKETSIPDSSLWLFLALGLSVLSSILLAISFNEFLFLGLPAALLLLYQTIVDFKKVFYVLLFTLPLSTEYYFPNGLGTDLPTEPLVVGLMLAYGLFVFMHWKSMKWDFLRHPISLFLLLHLLWMVFTMVTSSNILVSFKFLLAKIWYIVGYFYLAGSLLKTEKDVKNFFWVIFIPFTIAVVVTLYRHSTYNFSFDDVKYVMQPCFRNHVLYAAILAVFLPFIILATNWYNKKNPIKWALLGAVFLFLVAVYLSYTRTAYISLVIAFGSYFLIRLRLMKIVSFVSFIGIFVMAYHVTHENKYMDYAPDFEKTVSHHNFDDLVSATAQGQDVSTMERVYRWVAGLQMTKEQKIVGYGPGNFYNFYRQHAVTAFETYVSDNPEKSGIHSYYLMIMVDQGIPGAFIFLLLTFFVLIKGENIYHQTRKKQRKKIVMALMLSIIIIDAFLLINDMVETDKVGAFFFMNMALLINVDLLNKKEKKQSDKLEH